MPKHNDLTFRRFALALMDKQPGQTVIGIASETFSVGMPYAKRKAWDWKNNPICQEEMQRIALERESNDPATKESKLLNNKILMDEAFGKRATDKDAVDRYIRISRMDNEMQGHTKSSEVLDEKVKGDNAVMFELMKQLREKNKNALKSANQEIISI